MTTTDPLSLTEAKRLAATADTILLRATRAADLETPIGAFLRLDDGATPAYLLESVEGGERLGRYSFLGIGPRRLLEVRDGRRRGSRPGRSSVDAYTPGPAGRRVEAPDPLAALRAFVPRRRVQPIEGMPRFTGGAVGALAYDAVVDVRAVRPAARRGPGRRPDGGFIETDLVLVFDHLTHTLSRDRVAAHRGPRPRGSLPDRRAGHLRGPRADGAPQRGRDGRRLRAIRPRPTARRCPRSAARSTPGSAATPISRPWSTQRTPSPPGEAIQVVLARRQSFDLPPGADGASIDGIGLYRALRRVNPSPYLFFVADAHVRGRRRQPGAARSRSLATA